MNSLVLRRARGFTLIELLITLSVVAVLLVVALPGMQSFFDRERLIAATEQIYSHLQQARIESISRSRDIYLKFDTTDGLTYGFSQNSDCDLTIDGTALAGNEASACVLIVDNGDGNARANFEATAVDLDDLVLMRYDLAQYNGQLKPITVSTTQVVFDNLRGIPFEVDSSGNPVRIAPQIELKLESSLGRKLNLNIGSLGQINICSPDDSVSGYSKCPG